MNALSSTMAERPEDEAPKPRRSRMFSRLGLLRCPVCKSATIVFSSELIEDLFREYYIDCRNAICGLRFKGSLTLDYVVRPSSITVPGLNLPTRIPTPSEVNAAADRLLMVDDDPDQTSIFEFLNPATETSPHHDPP
jgi:hypothetical protein